MAKLAKLYHNPTTYFSTPLKPFARKTKKNTKYNHVSLCSTRDPTHIHTVINRFRAIASPPRGHRRQAQRSCPPRERPPEGILNFFFCALGFLFFCFFGEGVRWVQLSSRGFTIHICHGKIGLFWNTLNPPKSPILPLFLPKSGCLGTKKSVVEHVANISSASHDDEYMVNIRSATPFRSTISNARQTRSLGTPMRLNYKHLYTSGRKQLN